jgi:hypothetical protein
MLASWKLSPKSGESRLTTDTASRDRLKAVLKLNEYVSKRRVVEETGWNDTNRTLKETLDSFMDEKKIIVIALQNSRDLVKKYENDAKWVEWQKIKVPLHGQAPIFYKWVGE